MDSGGVVECRVPVLISLFVHICLYVHILICAHMKCVHICAHTYMCTYELCAHMCAQRGEKRPGAIIAEV